MHTFANRKSLSSLKPTSISFPLIAFAFHTFSFLHEKPTTCDAQWFDLENPEEVACPGEYNIKCNAFEVSTLTNIL